MSAVALLQAATDRVVESVTTGGASTPDLSTDARREAAELAAAIAKDVPGAGADWKQAFPRSSLTFARAAEEGTDFLSRPTPTLARVVATNNGTAAAYAHALADVASAGRYPMNAPLLKNGANPQRLISWAVISIPRSAVVDPVDFLQAEARRIQLASREAILRR